MLRKGFVFWALVQEVALSVRVFQRPLQESLQRLMQNILFVGTDSMMAAMNENIDAGLYRVLKNVNGLG